MSGSIKVGGHTVFVHTGASGAGTLSVQGQNGNVLLSDDGTAVHLGNNVRLPASGGIKDSSGNNIITESGGNVSIGNIRLPASGGIKDSSGNNILTESGGNVSIGDIRLHTNSAVRDSSGNAIITDVAGSAVVAPSAGGIPPGAVSAFAMTAVPTGWLECNGAAINRTTYSGLFSAISTTYGTGDGSTTFNLPDLRGEFIRGWDNGRGRDNDGSRVFGSAQDDQLKTHRHGASVGRLYTYCGNCYHMANSITITDPNNISGSVESRPKNVAMKYCIKY